MRLKKYLFLLILIPTLIVAVPNNTDTPVGEKRFSIDVKDMDIRDAIRMISKGYDLNILLDKEVKGQITIHLNDIPVAAGLQSIVETYGWELTEENGLFKIGMPAKSWSSEITVKAGNVTADISNQEVNTFINEISKKAQISIVPNQKLTGTVSAKLYRVPIRDAIETILTGSGFTVDYSNKIFTVGKGSGNSSSGHMNSGKRRGKFRIKMENKLLSLDVVNGNLDALIGEIADESQMQVVVYGKLSGQVNAKLNSIPLDEGLALILGGTKYTFVERDSIILIGDRNGATPSGQALTTSKLIHLKHIKADEIPKILPKNIPAHNVKVVKEQNGLLISGTSEDIVKTRNFLQSIDIPTPQVTLDVLMVEYNRDLEKEFGFSFDGNTGSAGSNMFSYPEIKLNRTGSQAKSVLKGVFGDAPFITKLPDDFNMSLKLLESHDKAKVLAQPSITVLNGNKAQIDVGRTSYYRVSGGTADNPTHNFRPINSGIKVTITPWISQSGQITMELSPEISNMTGKNDDGYPDISRRSIQTTVRIDDGKTLVLGGLLKGEDVENNSEVPFFGRFFGNIPIIGILFKSIGRLETQSNLVVYVTPRILRKDDYVYLPDELKKIEENNREVFRKSMEHRISEHYGDSSETIIPIPKFKREK